MRETKSQEPGKEFRHFTAHRTEYQMLMNLKRRADFLNQVNTMIDGMDGDKILTIETIVI